MIIFLDSDEEYAVKKNLDTKIGCFLTAVLFVLIAVLYKGLPFNKALPPPSDEISWARAVEKCKTRYENLNDSWKVKIPNCRKRTDDENYFYFYWTKPVSIFVTQSNGEKSANKGECRVAKKSGDIVYMTFNKRVVVDKLPK